MPALETHWGWDASFSMMMRQLHGARPKRPRPKATAPVELDVSGFPKKDQRFIAGVLALPSCPRKPVEARRYLQVFLEARAELKSGGKKTVVVGRGKARRHTAPALPNSGPDGDDEEFDQ